MLKQINLNKSNLTFVVFIIILLIILLFLPTGYENPKLLKNSERIKAKVIKIDNKDLEKQGLIVVGTQELELEIITGTFKGQKLFSKNILNGNLTLDHIYREEDKVLAVIKIDPLTKKAISARAIDLYRINTTIILFVLFAGFLILFAKWVGFKALLSFIFTAFIFWKILLPLLLKGYNPLGVSFLLISFVTTIIIILISGFTKKGVVALAGSIAGIAITTLLAIIFGYFFRIPGAIKDFSEMLLYSGFTNLKLNDIFISCIFISAAGAVMDVAMDIAASQEEIVEKKPNIKRNELIKSGINIASPVIGTMTTTLLFAYSGSFMFVFMVFMSKGTPLISVINTNFIAAEILHTLVGSFGLVLVAPLTAIIGGFIYTQKDKTT